MDTMLKLIRKYSAQTLNLHTIYALSSGHGKCGVAVIRVSGPDTKIALEHISRFRKQLPEPRYAYLRSLYHPASNELIDRGLVLWFPGPKSFTGEDTCEFQVHGSSAIIDCMLDALSSIDGFRQAKPGEFTKRAFYNSKLDLTEVEGLADLIHSETEAQRKQALLQANGSLAKLYSSWRQALLRSIAHLEAYIDFAEDENIESGIFEEVNIKIGKLRREISAHLNDGRKGELLRSGVRATILGAPNVGKSSFINLICQKPISIVTNIEGTTRDVIESYYNIGGYPVILADTAGLRKSTDDAIEIEGISRAIECAKNSDFIILVLDSLSFINSNSTAVTNSINNIKTAYLCEIGFETQCLEHCLILTIFNKIDLLSVDQLNQLKSSVDGNTVFLSCKSNEGLEHVILRIIDNLKSLCGTPTAENPVISQARHRYLFVECVEHLDRYLDDITNLSDFTDYGILAQNLRNAVRSIGQITGDVNTEEVLDVIFRDFCIGK